MAAQDARMLSLSLAALPALLLAAPLAFAASAYLFFSVRKLPPGWQRLAASLPVLALYAVTPRLVDPSRDTMVSGVLFCVLTWLASFRVLSFCWAEGILMEPFANRDVLRFHASLSLPVHARPADWQPRRERGKKKDADYGKGVLQWLVEAADSDTWPVLIARSCFKCICLVAVCQAYDYEDRLNAVTLQALYALNLFLVASLICDALAAVVQLLLGMPVEPHFDQPYLASSLEDFWSRRWNLLISGLLRDTIYHPLLRLLTSQNAASAALSNGKSNGRTPASHLNGSQRPKDFKQETEMEDGEEYESMQKGVQGTLRHRAAVFQSATVGRPSTRAAAATVPLWARLAAMFASFFVSGIMHELMVFYLSGKVTGEMTAFFTLHGVATALEALVKSLMKGRAGLPRVLAVPLTVGFAFLTGQWLFFAPLLSLGLHQQVVNNIRDILGA